MSPMSMQPQLEARVEELRRRAAAAVWVGAMGRWLAVGCVALASLALCARGGLEWSSGRAAWLLAPLALVPIAAWLAVRRRVPERGDAAAWLDRRAHARGLLLTLRERPDERWDAHAAEQLARLPEPPRIGLTRVAPRLAACAAFALGVLLLPLPRSAAAPPTDFFERLAAELAGELTTLAANAALDPELSTELLERVQSLTELASRTTDGEGFLEAFDALSARIAGVASGAGARLLEAEGALARLSGAAAQDPERALAMLRGARPLFDALSAVGELPPELARALEAAEGARGPGAASAGELREFVASLGESLPALRDELRERVDAMRGAGLLRGALGDAGRDELAREGAPLLAGRASAATVGTDGDATAPLRWGEEARAAFERFRARALPRGPRSDPAHSTPIGALPAAPEVAPLAGGGGDATPGDAALRAAWQRALAPRHRAAVRDFFQPAPRPAR